MTLPEALFYSVLTVCITCVVIKLGKELIP